MMTGRSFLRTTTRRKARGACMASALAVSGCYSEEGLEELIEAGAQYASSSSTSSSGGEGSGPFSTVTTAAPMSSGGGGAGSGGAGAPDELPGEDPPPTISALSISPLAVTAAGPLTATVTHSADVVAVELWRGEAPWDPLSLKKLGETPPTSATTTTMTTQITNAPGEVGVFGFFVIVRDGGGLSGSSEVITVSVDLPASGSVAWEAAPTPAPALLAAGLAVRGRGGVTFAGGLAVATDKIDEGAATITKFGSSGLSSWTGEPATLVDGSLVSAIAADTLSEDVIASGYTTPTDWTLRRPWARRVRADGTPLGTLWLGNTGEQVEASTVLADGRVVLVGSKVQNPKKIQDAQVWILPGDLSSGVPVSLSWEHPAVGAEDPPRDEAFAVALSGSGDIVVAGETHAWKEGPKPYFMPRAFVLRLSPGGALLSSWVADATLGEHSGARGVSIDPKEGGILLAGWSQIVKGAATAPMLARLSDDGLIVDSWYDYAGVSADSSAIGLERSPSGQLVAGFTRFEDGRLGLEIRGASAGWMLIDEPQWRYTFSDALNEGARLSDLSIDESGFVHFAGWGSIEVNDKITYRAIAGKLHP